MLDFPSAPSTGQKYPASVIAGIPQYTWDGEKWTTVGAGSATSAPPAAALPLMDATPAVVGVTTKYAREDHVHPSDTSRIPRTGDLGLVGTYFTTGNLYAIGSFPFANQALVGNMISQRSSVVTEFAFNAYYDNAATWRLLTGGWAYVNYFNITTGNLVWASSGGSNTIGAAMSLANNMQLTSAGLLSTAAGFSQLNYTAQRLWYDGSASRLDMSGTNGVMSIYASDHLYLRANNGLSLRLQTDGNMSLYTQAYKPGGGPWIDNSDARIKNVIGDYARGLADIVQLRPVDYTFKGNDTNDAPSLDDGSFLAEGETRSIETPAVPYPNSPHVHQAKAAKQFTGLIAQEVEAIFPEIVTKRDGYIDGVAVTDFRDLDAGPLVFALINAVKELKARIEVLEGGG